MYEQIIYSYLHGVVTTEGGMEAVTVVRMGVTAATVLISDGGEVLPGVTGGCVANGAKIIIAP